MDAATVHRRRWAILAVLNLSLFVIVVDNTIVNVALPTISRDLSATTSQLQWIVDAYSLVFAGLLLAAGSLGDRFGRKGALQLGMVLFAACSLLAALAQTPAQLIAARAAMGVGAALIFPATLAILTNVFTEPSERAKAIGVWAGVTGLAVALGPVTGGWILEHYSWGAIFLVNLPIAAVALLLGRVLVPTSRDPEAPRLDPLGLLLSIVGVVTLVWATIEAPTYGWTSATILGAYAFAATVLVAFVFWERRNNQPMLDVRIFSNARFSAASVAVAFAFFALFGFVFLITQYFQVVRGYDTLSAGVHTLPFAVATGIAAPLSARLALRIGTKTVVTAGLVIMGIGFLVASTNDADSAYWGPVVLAMVLIAAGLGLTTAPATEAIMGSLPPGKAGVGSAVNDTTRELGGTLGVAVLGSVFSSFYGPRLGEALQGLPIPAAALEAAKESVQATLAVAEQAGAGAPVIVQAAQTSFVEGLRAGSLVAAAVVFAGAVLAFVFLPARARPITVGGGSAQGLAEEGQLQAQQVLRDDLLGGHVGDTGQGQHLVRSARGEER
jgi:EmrB/QacA subfamily drug resistance transporter